MYRATRVGDHHVCNHHVGKGAKAGALTVLINNRPAIRQGDKLECEGGPEDVVTGGEPNVRIANKYAARLGHRTQHAGQIDEGSPNVLIGSSLGGLSPDSKGKEQRLGQRLAIIAAARDKLSQPGLSPSERASLQHAVDELARLNLSVDYVRLAGSGYNGGGAPPGYSRLDPKSLPPDIQSTLSKMGINRDPKDDIVVFRGKDGFSATLFKSDIDGSAVLVFRGTEDLDDWLTNLAQGAGFPAGQYQNAVELAAVLKDYYASQGVTLQLAGDSLGGGLAASAALKTGLPTETFNASGVHWETVQGYGLDRANESWIVHNRLEGEILTTLQDWVGGGLKFLSGPAAWFGLAPSPMPGALGRTYTIPPRTLPCKKEDGIAKCNPTVDQVRRRSPVEQAGDAIVTAILGGTTSSLLAEAIDRHMPWSVELGMEASKLEALAVLTKAVGTPAY